MSYDAKILADSMSPAGVRLTTIQITLPRFELPALNTHRDFARNSASSRAIPVEKQIERVLADPYVPEAFGKNQRGMQSEHELLDQDGARQDWMLARDSAVYHARAQMGRETHKQIANRLLEPFMWQTIIITATNWRNFFALRMHKDAQAEIRKVACMMHEVMGASSPTEIGEGQWHLPLVHDIDASDIVLSYDIKHAALISAGRCARVSYLTHDGRRDLSADLTLVERLASVGHVSPFEHPARPATLEDAFEQAARLGIYGAKSYDLTKMPFGKPARLVLVALVHAQRSSVRRRRAMSAVRMSKFLSLILRHEPQTIGISLDSAGWVDAETLIAACNAHGHPLTRKILDEIVETNSKKRFAFSEDGLRIRASQGHSVAIDLGLEPQVPPAELFHGTAASNLDSIFEHGLLKGERQHVHLSADEDTARIVGTRHGRPVVLLVDAAAAHADGLQFFLSENSVWLIEHVPMQYLRVGKKENNDG